MAMIRGLFGKLPARCGRRKRPSDTLSPKPLTPSSRKGVTVTEWSGNQSVTNVKALTNLAVCLPDRPAQDALAARLDDPLAAATTVLASARAELKAIEALPAAVLRRVFS